jgi:two-component system OmpR family response regulator
MPGTSGATVIREGKMRVLVVENDPDAGRKILGALRNAYYVVDWVRDGKSGGIAMRSTYYAAVLLNPHVADINGVELLRTTRSLGNRVPVLLLTEPDDVDTRVLGLDVGADDCLLKPLDDRELVAQLRAVLRRAAGYATSRIGDDSVCLDLDKKTMMHSGVESALSAREFALMHAFLERRGSILSRDQLEERLYGWGREIESNAIDVLIHAMRKRFGRTLIRNVRGLGWTVAPGMAPYGQNQNASLQ